jgi:hypothetical protein
MQSLVSLTGCRAHQWVSLFQFPTHFASKTIQWLTFNEKYEKTNYSTVNACGLAIFSNVLLHAIYLSFSEIPIPHMDSPEAIRFNLSKSCIFSF